MSKAKNMRPSIERLREALNYDPITGYFTWKIKPAKLSIYTKIGHSAGTFNKVGYLRIHLDKIHVFGHIIAWAMFYNEWPKGVIDHIDGNRSNNAISNLRDTTQSINVLSAERPPGVTGIRGVSLYHNSGKYKTSIIVNNTNHFLGIFASIEEASHAYECARTKALEGKPCTNHRASLYTGDFCEY